MINSLQQTIQDLKENNEDFEFYPSTKKMFRIVYDDLKNEHRNGSLLDIGCGDGRLQKYFKQWHENEMSANEEYFILYDYYVIEKSKILMEKLVSNVTILSTDFHQTTLIDKENIDFIFCNPPYSEFDAWVVKIIKEAYCNVAYLIIPDRWINNEKIQKALTQRGVSAEIIHEDDFKVADRPARSKINIIKIDFRVKERKYQSSIYDKEYKTEKIAQDPFDIWFEENFKIKAEKKQTWEEENKEETELKNEIELGRKFEDVLVEMYNKEVEKLNRNFIKLGELDKDLFSELNIGIDNIKQSFKIRIAGLKNKYWQKLFDKTNKITNRLTQKTRVQLQRNLRDKGNIDFNADNIYMIILYVITNGNKYYNEQLIDLFLELTDAGNIKNYKSNQKTWKKEDWRYNKKEYTHYTLDYRLIIANNFDTYILNDLMIVANNLDFKVLDTQSIDYKKDGKSREIYFNNKDKEEVLFEYKCYKNNAIHIRVNKQFMKCFNIQVSKLLGWIKHKEDIIKEFDYDLDITDKDVDEYYNQQNLQISNNNIQLLLNS